MLDKIEIYTFLKSSTILIKIQKMLMNHNGGKMLRKKMIRDIFKHKTQFLSIFLMAFLGVFVFTGISGEYIGLEDNINDYYEETNLADGWIYSPYLNDLFLEQVNHLGATTQMERQLIVDSVADFENNPEITLHFVENNTISKFYLIEGEPLDINDSNGVWLDKGFADYVSKPVEIRELLSTVGRHLPDDRKKPL